MLINLKIDDKRIVALALKIAEELSSPADNPAQIEAIADHIKMVLANGLNSGIQSLFES